MPRQAMTPSTPPKPYDRPSTPSKETKPDIKPNTPSRSPKSERRRTDTSGRKWTSEELLNLFNHVLKVGQKDWDKAVEGRTANQCNQTWRQTLLPFIKQSIESKGV